MEKMVVLETRHCPYMSKKQLAEELGYGETSIYKLIKGFEEEVGAGSDMTGASSQGPDTTFLQSSTS